MKAELRPGETASFYLNPYFDELIGLLESVPTSQEKLKPIDAEKRIFHLYEKNNVTEFKRRIKERLETKKKPWWPYTEYLTVVVAISGPKKDVEKKDLDNYLKTVFDTMKGLVIDEDYKIFRVEARKEIMDDQSGFIICIRRNREFNDDPIPYYLFSGNKDHWKLEREQKMKTSDIYTFDFY